MTAEPLVSFDNLRELTDACISFYEENKEKMSVDRVHEKRAKLSGFAQTFHNDCGTLSPSVERRIEDLKSGNGLILMVAHQPNLFAYSGVFRKATLNFVLAKTLEERLKVPVVNFFGIADQDFTDDRWVRSCQLPTVQRSGGIFSVDMKLPKKLMLNTVVGPSKDVLESWKVDLEKWLSESISSVERYCKAVDLECCIPSAELRENLLFLWDIVEHCGKRSRKYSDFNAFVMSKIVNDVWGYDTVFSRFSECQQIFTEEFSFLLSCNDDYSHLLAEARDIPRENVASGVSHQEPWLVPFWYHCDCGSKAKLFLNEEGGCLFGEGNCLACGEQYKLEFGPESSPDLSRFASRISARAIAMALVFFRGLLPSCYVGGAGGIGYLVEAKHVAKGLKIPFPPIAIWRPRDKYSGVAQIEALMESKRICKNFDAPDLLVAKALLDSRVDEIHERIGRLEDLKNRLGERLKEHPNDEELKKGLEDASKTRTRLIRSSNLSVLNHESKILENVSTVLSLMPSIIDYAVNIGLKQTSDQWKQHLIRDGNLSSDINLKSILNQSLTLTG